METVHLLGEHAALIGILTRPDTPAAAGSVAVILLNSGLQHRVGPFRLYVELARKLADHGFPVLRIDQSGKGDSERRKGLSFPESIEADFRDAAGFLAETVQAERIIVIGLCSGADDALYIASRSAQAAGVVLLDGYAARTAKYYMRHYGPRMLKVASWRGFVMRFLGNIAIAAGIRRLPRASEPSVDLIDFQVPAGRKEMRARFVSAIRHDAKLLCVFTSGVEDYYNHYGQLADWLGPVCRNHITEVFIEGAEHTYPLAVHRNELISTICNWVGREFPAAEPVSSLHGTQSGLLFSRHVY